MVTIYFGLGTALSIYGCSKFTDENVAAVAAADMDYMPHGLVAKPSMNTMVLGRLLGSGVTYSRSSIRFRLAKVSITVSSVKKIHMAASE